MVHVDDSADRKLGLLTTNSSELVGVEGFHQGFEVVAHKGVAAIVWGPYEGDPEGQVETLLASHFRPIRTQAEREREETVDEALGYLEYRTRNLDAEDELMKGRLNALYDAGMLRKGDS